MRTTRRPAPPDVLPQPRAVRREIREVIARLYLLGLVYNAEHEALVTLGSSDVHVAHSPGSLTEVTWADGQNEAARQRCAEAVAQLRSAAVNVEQALRAFGPQAIQPERSPDAIVDQSTFNRARHRHYRREQELRVK